MNLNASIVIYAGYSSTSLKSRLITVTYSSDDNLAFKSPIRTFPLQLIMGIMKVKI